MKEIFISLSGSPVVWSVTFSLLAFIAGVLVKKTKTTRDDEIYNTAMRFINAAFIVAEKAIPDSGSGKLNKADIALKDFNARYEQRFGLQAPTNIKDIAKAEWAIMAAEIKKAKS